MSSAAARCIAATPAASSIHTAIAAIDAASTGPPRHPCATIAPVTATTAIPPAGAATDTGCSASGPPTGARCPDARAPPAAAPADPSPPVEPKSPTGAIIKPIGSINTIPTYPGIIEHIKTPGPGPRTITPPQPGIIIIPRSIDEGRIVDITIQVTRSIPHHHIRRLHIIDLDILRMIHRVGRRDQIHLIRPVRAHHPGALRAFAGIPYTLVKGITRAARLEYRSAGIDGIFQGRTFDRPELRRAIIIDVRTGRLPVDL